MIITFIINQTNALEVGMQIPPSRVDANDLLADINLLHQEIYTIDYFGKDTLDKKLRNQLDSLHNKLSKVINEYLINNSCLRYYLSEQIASDEIDLNTNDNNGILIALNLKFETEMNTKIQILNLNIFDAHGNTLRRINNIKDNKLNLLFHYPLTENDEEFFNLQYIDICFENLKYDKSWNSKPNTIDSFVEILFGMQSLSDRYQKSTELIDKSASELVKIDGEIDLIIDQLFKNLKTSERDLRNKNEDTLNKFMIFFIVIFVMYLCANLAQIYWLINYLKKRSLL